MCVLMYLYNRVPNYCLFTTTTVAADPSETIEQCLF